MPLYRGGSQTRRLAVAGAELLGPDVGAAVAFELADLEADADVLVGAENVLPVAAGAHPHLEDRARGRVAAAAVGDVLALAAAPVADPLDPVGELAPAGFVAEFVAAEDVGRL